MMHGQAVVLAPFADWPVAPVLQGVLGLQQPVPFPASELFVPLTAERLVPCAPPALHPPAQCTFNVD